MNDSTRSAATQTLPETVTPVREPVPAVDPQREALEGIQADCFIHPRKYLEESRVVGGGE